MDDEPTSRPLAHLARIIGNTALMMGLAAMPTMLAAAQHTHAKDPLAVQWEHDKAEAARVNRKALALTDFRDLGVNARVYTTVIHSPEEGLEPNYLRTRGDIDDAVAEARGKTDAYSLRLTSWADQTAVAKTIKDPETKAYVAHHIVKKLLTYDDEKAGYASHRQDSPIWSKQPWDQSVQDTIGNGKGVCVDYMTALMETDLRVGFSPKDVAGVRLALYDKNQSEYDLHSDEDYHATAQVHVGRKVLVQEQNKIYDASDYFGLVSPAFPRQRADIRAVGTLSTTSLYMPVPGKIPAPKEKERDSPWVEHDYAIMQKIWQMQDNLGVSLSKATPAADPATPVPSGEAMPSAPRTTPLPLQSIRR